MTENLDFIETNEAEKKQSLFGESPDELAPDAPEAAVHVLARAVQPHRLGLHLRNMSLF